MRDCTQQPIVVTMISSNCIIPWWQVLEVLEKNEFVKQLLSLKHHIMTNPPESIVCFYGKHIMVKQVYQNSENQVSQVSQVIELLQILSDTMN